ncbi:MAG: DUF2851 family protein [Candidatus Neomarinimicrobiota bacterium]|nr:MAG: DUF2851 family protein [Candidatus Neomarinimicrobiota bacterium]
MPPEFLSPPLAVREPPPETDLVRTWLHLPPGKILRTLQGDDLLLLQPGTPNRNAGPDIRGARVWLGGHMQTGDVEFHLRPRDWFDHGHDRDPRYRRVILHVVMRPGRKGPHLPTVVLAAAQPDRGACPVPASSPQWLILLDRWGRERWRQRVHFWFQPVSADRLWLELLRLLGKGGNESLWVHCGRRLTAGRGIQKVDPDRLPARARRLQLPWRHCGIRPAAWPEKRLDWLTWIGRQVQALTRAPEKITLEQVEQVCRFPKTTAYLTEARGNVWYPWGAAQALRAGKWAEADAFRRAWDGLRLHSPYGRLVRRWPGAGARLRHFPLAQGGLLLQGRYCSRGSCTGCPLFLSWHDPHA